MEEGVLMPSTIESNELKLFISKPLLRALRRTVGEEIEILFGARSASATIDVLGEGQYAMAPTTALSDELNMVTGLTYRIMNDGPNSIILGPVIGLLMSLKHSKLNLDAISRFVGGYKKVQGLVFCFAYDGVNWEKKEVNGFYYSPVGEGSWVPGTFPLPSAVFRRTFLSFNRLNRFLREIPGGIINQKYPFNKWINYTHLMKCETMRPHLKETHLVKDARTVIDLLSQYNSVYVKPCVGERGVGIIRVDITDTGFSVGFNSKENGPNKKEIDSLDGLVNILMELGVGKTSYIVQAAIPLAKYENRFFDFRIMVQRSGSGELVCTGVIGRLAKPESVVSNITAGGSSFPAKDLIMKGFNINRKDADKLMDKCMEVAYNSVRCLEVAYGPLGDIGVDVGLDIDACPWLIECNPVPDYSIFIGFDDKMYSEMTNTPLHYISHLAGFTLSK